MAKKLEVTRSKAFRFLSLAIVAGLSVSYTNCAKSTLQFDLASSNSVTPPGTGPGGGNVQLQFVEAPTILRMSGRAYVTSLLTQIFGPVGAVTNQNYTFAQNFVNHEINPFGEPCDMYEAAAYQGASGPVVFDDPTEFCSWPNDSLSGIQETLVPSLVSSGTLREANRIQTCQNAIVAPTAMNTAISQVAGASLTVAPNATTLGEAYALFYNGQVATPDIISALEDLTASIPAPITPASQWQAVMLTLCLAPDWQIL